MVGEKQYHDNSSIIRVLEIFPGNKIQIRDSAQNGDSLVAFFNIHPQVRTIKLNDKEILMQTPDSMNFNLLSNCDIELTEGIISQSTAKITAAKRLEIKGNPIETTILFPEMKLEQPMILVTPVSITNNRLMYAKKLEAQFVTRNYDISAKKLVLNKSFPYLMFIILFIAVCEGPHIRRLLKKTMYQSDTDIHG